MISHFKEILLSAFSRAGMGAGERTRTLIRGLQWMLPIALITRVMTGLVTVAAARFLGPANFGLINLALASALWIQVPLFMGLPTSLMHFVPKAPTGERDQWSSVGILLLALTGGLTLILGMLGAPFWARLQAIPTPVFRWGLFWCAGFGLFSMVTTLANAREQFQKRAMMDVSFAILMASVLGFFIFSQHLTPRMYLCALAGAYALSAGIGVYGLPLRLRMARGPDTLRIAKDMTQYGFIASLGGIVAALFYSAGRLVANRYLSLPEVGILSAYQAGTVQMSSFFLAIVTQAFFPLASRTPDKKVLLQKSNRMMLAVSPILAGGLILIAVLYFKILGKQYPLSLVTLVLYAAAAVLALAHGQLSWLLASSGIKGIWLSSIIGLVGGLVNWGGCCLWIPHARIAGAAFAGILASGVGVILCEAAALWAARVEDSGA